MRKKISDIFSSIFQLIIPFQSSFTILAFVLYGTTIQLIMLYELKIRAKFFPSSLIDLARLLKSPNPQQLYLVQDAINSEIDFNHSIIEFFYWNIQIFSFGLLCSLHILFTFQILELLTKPLPNFSDNHRHIILYINLSALYI